MSASFTSLPRIRSMTSRAFCGDILINLPVALLIIYRLLLSGLRSGHRRRCTGGSDRLVLAAAGAVPFKRSCGRKFTELVTHHVFRDVHGNEFLSIMDGDRMP